MKKSAVLLICLAFFVMLSGTVWAQTIADPNLAFGATVDSTNATNAANWPYLFDNDLTTNFSGQQSPIYTSIDLGEAKTFDFVGYMSYKGRSHSYVLVDKATGDTLVDRSAELTASNTFIDEFTADTLDTPATAQNLILYITDGSSGWRGCNELVLKKLNGVYNAPLLKGEGASAHSLHLMWQLLDETPVDAFNIYAEDGTLLTTVGGDKVDAVVGSYAAGYEPATTYKFWIEAVVGTDAVTGDLIEATTLPRMTNLSASALSANSVELTWHDNAADEDGFEIYQVDEDGTMMSLGFVGQDVTTYVIDGLTDATMYTFAVAPIVGGVAQEATMVDVTTMPGATHLQAMRYSVEAIHLSFDDNGATNDGFYVFSSYDKMAWDTLMVENKADTLVTEDVMVEGLMANTTYYFTVVPYSGEEMWTPSDTVHATTYPWLPAMTKVGTLFDEDFTDGQLDNPMAWEMPGNGYSITAPNLRDSDFALTRRIAAGGETWSDMPVWGHFRDRNDNGMKDPGEYVPYAVNLDEDVVVLKAKHYSDIASGSTEYYNINPRIHGLGAHNEGLLQLKLNYNTKGPNGYNRQVHPMVNGEQYPDGAPAWQLPPYLSYGNFGMASDSTLSESWENLILYRPVVDSTTHYTNVEAWTENAPAYDGDWMQTLGDGMAYIDHVQFLMVRPSLRSGLTVRNGVAEKDFQLGVEHMQLGVTKKADFNLDYFVGIEDFFRMASGWGDADTVRIGREIFIYAKTMLQGDGNNDGMVNLDDFEVLKSLWNKGKRERVMHYQYDMPQEMHADHRLVAEVNVRTGMVTLRGVDSLKCVGYKLVSPSGGFAYYPASKLFKNSLTTFTASEVSEANNAPFMFTAPGPRGDADNRAKALGKIYNTDINPRDVKLVWQDDFGGETMIGGVTYIDMEFDGVMSTMVAETPPDTTNELVFAHYTAEKDRRNIYWHSGGGRDVGQQFMVDAVTVLDKVTMAVFPHAWGNMVQELEAAQDDGCFLEIVKTPTYENSNQVSETIAKYYGNLPSQLDTLNNRFITFDLPEEGITLTPLGGDSTYGFIFGFASPKDGRVLNVSITHPYKDEFEVPDYMGGSKIDLTWSQARDIDGSYKYNPQGWEWGHQLTFWCEASSIGGTAVESKPLANIPTNYELSQNYPNPFNPSTTITFSLPEPSEVSLAIYDITGRQVREITNEQRDAGIHNVVWDAMDDNGLRVSSGVYYYRLQANDHVFTKKMMLIK